MVIRFELRRRRRRNDDAYVIDLAGNDVSARLQESKPPGAGEAA